MSKFSPLTSSLLVRKGEAAPSQLPRSRARPSANGRGKPGTETGGRTVVFYPDEGSRAARKKSSGKKARRIILKLTPDEYETLGLVAAKKGVTRDDLAQSAVTAYLEWLVGEGAEG